GLLGAPQAPCPGAGALRARPRPPRGLSAAPRSARPGPPRSALRSMLHRDRPDRAAILRALGPGSMVIGGPRNGPPNPPTLGAPRGTRSAPRSRPTLGGAPRGTRGAPRSRPTLGGAPRGTRGAPRSRPTLGAPRGTRGAPRSRGAARWRELLWRVPGGAAGVRLGAGGGRLRRGAARCGAALQVRAAAGAGAAARGTRARA